MSRRAAGLIAAAVVTKPDAVLGLATGDSPIGAYGYLCDWYRDGHIDFSQASALNLDEYCGIEPDAVQSYSYFMRRYLFSKINISSDNQHIPDGLARDPGRECVRYDAIIAARGGIDVQLLGIGLNGHIGFNEPGPEFVKDTHVVALSESTIDANSRFFDDRRDVPVKAYTMGICTIMRARRIVLIASGERKADIIKRAFFDAVTPGVPASILQLHADVTLVGDEAALSLI